MARCSESLRRQRAIHDSQRLLDLADILEDAGRGLPEEYQELLDLTPYAVEFRYSSLPADRADQLSRRTVLAGVLGLREYTHQESAPGRSW